MSVIAKLILDEFVPLRFSPSIAFENFSANFSPVEMLPARGLIGPCETFEAIEFLRRTKPTRSLRSIASISAFSFNEEESLRTPSSMLSAVDRHELLLDILSARLVFGRVYDIGVLGCPEEEGAAESALYLLFEAGIPVPIVFGSNRPSAVL